MTWGGEKKERRNYDKEKKRKLRLEGKKEGPLKYPSYSAGKGGKRRILRCRHSLQRGGKLKL